jgi:glycosyltransferase involved in cell wall biosynthesis
VKISIVLPTRNRPESLERLYLSAMTTAAHPENVEFCVYVDDDDARTIEKLNLLNKPNIQATIGPRVVLSSMWDIAAKKATGEVFLQSGDDCIFRSWNWDVYVAAAFRGSSDRLIVVHGRDGLHDDKFGTHPFIHRRWIDTVGYFIAPYFSSDYGDTWLNDLANALGRRVYIPEVYTEHMHPLAKKANWDQTHLDRLARGKADDVDKLYASLEAERSRDVEKLRAAIRSSIP